MSKFVKTSFRTIVVLLISQLFLNSVYAEKKTCNFKQDKSLYVFSGAIAAMIYRLNLFDDPQIKGILESYEFRPTKNIKFSGGIYLSQKLAEGIVDNAIIFHEESLDLENTLKIVAKRKNKKWLQVKLITKYISPIDVSIQSLKAIEAYLMDSEECKKLVSNKLIEIDKLQKKIQAPIENVRNAKMKSIYFFLGKWKGKFPDTSALIVFQEGFIKELIQNKYMQSYDKDEATFNYAPWSAKKLKDKNSIFIGVDSQLQENVVNYNIDKIDHQKFQISCFGCLIPGILQLEWLSALTTHWNKL